MLGEHSGKPAEKSYFSKKLTEAEQELKEFREAVRHRQLRIRHLDINGERDMTASEDKVLEDGVNEYRAALDLS